MSDYNFLMESRLSPAQFQLLNDLSRIAHSEELNFYLVGGAVRDMTYGQSVIRDLDFAVEGNVQKILRHIRFSGGKGKISGKSSYAMDPALVEVVRSRVDKQLLTAQLWFNNGVFVEIAQCRQEIFTKPGRPPEALPAMIFDDLKGRDFALNAMAVSLHPNSRGLLLDPKNGVSDIERHEIRALHSRSFHEDPSRICRLLRLGLRLEFKPEEKTQRWFNGALEEGVWSNLTPESQGRELEAVLHEENPEHVLKLYASKGILAGLDHSLTHIPYDQFSKLRAVGRKIPGADLFLLHFDCIVSKLSGAQKSRLAKKILGDADTIKLALNLDREAKKMERLLGSSKYALPHQAFKLLSTQPEPLLLYMLAYCRKAKVENRLKNFLFKVPQVRARLPRRELQALGIKPGPKFEKIIERIFFDQLDGKIRTPQQLSKELRLLAGVKELAPEPAPPAGRKPAKAVDLVGKQVPVKTAGRAAPKAVDLMGKQVPVKTAGRAAQKAVDLVGKQVPVKTAGRAAPKAVDLVGKQVPVKTAGRAAPKAVDLMGKQAPVKTAGRAAPKKKGK